jgi:hypothetical protein
MSGSVPEEELGGVHRTSADEDLRGVDGARHAAVPMIAVRHDVAVALAAAGARDVPHLALRAHLRAGALGQREVVEIERVLRVNVAADVALAAVDAPRLGDAELVGRDLARRRVQVDGDVRVTELLGAPQLLRHLLHQQRLGGDHLAVGDGFHVEHVAHEIVVRVERLPGVALRPGAREHVGRRPEVDVGVDERAPAVPRGLDDLDLLHRLHVEEPLLACPEPPVGEAVEAARERASRVAPSALQDGDVDSRLRQATRGHRAAEARPDHDRTVGVLHRDHPSRLGIRVVQGRARPELDR